MKIEVGEYVRTKKGTIGKFKFNGADDADNIIVYFKNQYGTTCVDETDIVNHSKNIIDLIEVGDYVNGKQIECILETSIKVKDVAERILCFETDFPIEKGLRTYHNCDIKSIVTKEQYKNIEYRLE